MKSIFLSIVKRIIQSNDTFVVPLLILVILVTFSDTALGQNESGIQDTKTEFPNLYKKIPALPETDIFPDSVPSAMIMENIACRRTNNFSYAELMNGNIVKSIDPYCSDNQAPCFIRCIQNAYLLLRLHTGGSLNTHQLKYNGACSLSVNGSLVFRDVNNNIIKTTPITLTIKDYQPEAVYYELLPASEFHTASIANVCSMNTGNIHTIEFSVSSSTQQNVTGIDNHENLFKLELSVQTNFYTDVTTGTTKAKALCYSVEGQSWAQCGDQPPYWGGVPSVSSREASFSWNIGLLQSETTCLSCPDSFPNYQIQILRLYNTDPNKTNENSIKTTIDWSKALTLTLGKSTNLNLALLEGRGYYTWRVRPIGNLYPGGVNNVLNYGDWSDGSFSNLDEISISPCTAPKTFVRTCCSPHSNTNWKVFFYEGFEQDKNWVYSRSFDETSVKSVDRGESITYFDGIGSPKQSQVHVFSDENVITTEGINDYSGAQSVSFLPVPVKQSHLGYISGLTGSYNQASIDNVTPNGTNYKVPPAVTNGTINSFYSSSVTTTPISNEHVANANGYPFSKTIVGADGRVAEASGVGSAHMVGVLNAKTTKFSYGSVSEKELTSIMGDEAPDASKVFKTIYKDPDGQLSVEYSTIEGNVIATCLMPSETDIADFNSGTLNSENNTIISDNGANNQGLLHLKDEIVNKLSLVDVVTSKNSLFSTSNSKSILSKKYVFTSPRNITVDYKLTPNNFTAMYNNGANCSAYCAECDYIVKIRVRNIETNTLMQYTAGVQNGTEYIWKRQPSGCDEPSEEVLPTLTFAITEPGTYIVEREISALNKVDPDFTNNGFENFADYHAQTSVGTIRTLDDIFNSLFGNPNIPDPYLKAKQQLTFYRTNRQPPYKISINVGNSECRLLDLPDYKCPDRCNPLDLNFQKYLFENVPIVEDEIVPEGQSPNPKKSETGFRITYANGNPPEYNLDVYFVDPSGRPKALGLGAGNLSKRTWFNTLITNMQACGYTCDELWNAWEITVEKFRGKREKILELKEERAGDFGFVPYTTINEQGSREYFDLLEEFLIQVKKFKSLSSCSNFPCANNTNGVCFYVASDLNDPTKTFNYLTYNYRTVLESESSEDCGDPPTTQNQDDWLKYDACVRNTRMSEALRQVLIDKLAKGRDIGDIEALKKGMDADCKTKCEDRHDEFKQLVQKLYADNNIPNPDIDQINCLINLLTKDCKEACTLSVTTGNPTPTALQRYWEAMTYTPEIVFKQPDQQIPPNYTCPVNYRDLGGTGNVTAVSIMKLLVDYLNEMYKSYRPKPALAAQSVIVNFGQLACTYLTQRGYTAPPCLCNHPDLTILISAGDEGFFSIVDEETNTANCCDIIFSYSKPCENNPYEIVTQVNDFLDKIWGIVLPNNTPTPTGFLASTQFLGNSNEFYFYGIPQYSKTNPYQPYLPDPIKVSYNNQISTYLKSSVDDVFDGWGDSDLLDEQYDPLMPFYGVWTEGYRNARIETSSSLTTKRNCEELFYPPALSDKVRNTMYTHINFDFMGQLGSFIVDNSAKPPTWYKFFQQNFSIKPNVLSFTGNYGAIRKYLTGYAANGFVERVNLFRVKDITLGDKNDKWLMFGPIAIVFPLNANHPGLGDKNAYIIASLEPTNNDKFWNVGDDNTNAIVLPKWPPIYQSSSLRKLRSFKLKLRFGYASPNATFKNILDEGVVSNLQWAWDKEFTTTLGMTEIKDFVNSTFTQKVAKLTQDASGRIEFNSKIDNTVLAIENHRYYTTQIKTIACGEELCPQEKVCERICVRYKPKNFIIEDKPYKIVDIIGDCYTNTVALIKNNIEQQYNTLVKKIKDETRERYTTYCAADKINNDELKVQYSDYYYHYTLFYYDRVGNLVRTVPPLGVNIDPNRTRSTNPQHRLATQFYHNSLGQLIQRVSPDETADGTWITYDATGRARASQSTQQRSDGKFSFMNYDYLGRLVSSGVASVNTLWTNFDGFQNYFYTNPTATFSDAEERTEIDYGTTNTVAASTLPYPYDNLSPAPKNLRKRVRRSRHTNDGGTTWNENYYSYDAHGNVEWVIQKTPGPAGSNGICAKTRYHYDPVNGKVQRVDYRDGFDDRFYKKFQYDKDSRVIAVYTSKDTVIWERDVKYEFYPQGPVKRTILGEDNIQGQDFVYTVHGWLKGINHPTMNGTTDPGKDGVQPSNQVTTPWVSKDAYGMILGYYDGDYQKNNSPYNVGQNGTLANTGSSNTKPPQLTGIPQSYTGNIDWWTEGYYNTSATTQPATQPAFLRDKIIGNVFRYDKLHRLRKNDVAIQDGGTNTWSLPTTANYANEYHYDANGNAKTIKRTSPKTDGTTGSADNMDNLTLNYPLSGGLITSNKLSSVNEANGNGTDFKGDMDGTTNFEYDNKGRLKKETQGLTTLDIAWRTDNHVKETISKFTYDDNGSQVITTTTQYYDANDRKVRTKVVKAGALTTTEHTYYVYGADGTLLSMYREVITPTGSEGIKQIAVPLYGTGRVGQFIPQVKPSHIPTTSSAASGIYIRELGSKVYEVTDHLGNVRSIIGDKKIWDGSAFVPDIKSVQSYFPYGLPQPGRSYTITGNSLYRYGYNGVEQDPNMYGTDAPQMATEFRLNDPRLAGRWWSQDAVFQPWESPYSAMAGNPIVSADPSGLDEEESDGEDAGNTRTGKGTNDNPTPIPGEAIVKPAESDIPMLGEIIIEAKRESNIFDRIWNAMGQKNFDISGWWDGIDGELWRYGSVGQWGDIATFGYNSIHSFNTAVVGAVDAVVNLPHTVRSVAESIAEIPGGIAYFYNNINQLGEAQTWNFLSNPDTYSQLVGEIGFTLLTAGTGNAAKAGRVGKATKPLAGEAWIGKADDVAVATETAVAEDFLALDESLLNNGGYQQFGSYMLSGTTTSLKGEIFRRNILVLDLTAGETTSLRNIMGLLKTLESEAVASGASTFELYGGVVGNAKLLKPSTFQRMGYEYQPAGQGILLTKKIK